MPSRVDRDDATLAPDQSVAEIGAADTLAPLDPRPAAARSDTPPPATPLTSGAPPDSTTLPRDPAAEDARPGLVLADRYRLLERLGEGAHGEVWTALDLVLHTPAALKWMRSATGPSLARIRREITALRMLRAPGVVRLLDDGIAHGRPFLVMERVDGLPFPGHAPPSPGTPRRWGWSALADPTFALLEILSRVHAAGVVHRDLKPDNILVSAEGRPTVLDFGISLWSAPGSERLTAAGQLLGTPVYLAPEQILDRPVDARADLYAVGVMLFEALTGRWPHEGPDLRSLLHARLLSPAPSARDLAPDLPAIVADVLDRLLATRTEDRPRSASEVLAALRGEAPAARAESALPWLGDRRPLTAVLQAVAAGHCIDIVGPPGSGRSRCLSEIGEALARQGRRVARTGPGRSPLAGLQPVAGVPGDHTALRLAEITARVEQELQAALAQGMIVLADDADSELDPWSKAALDRCRAGPGVIVRALSAAPAGARPEQIAALTPLDAAALEPLFAGPDRLFHLREDASRALLERTEGLPARVEAELTLWTRLGLARRQGAELVVDRDALHRLHAGLPGATPAAATPAGLAAEPHLGELLRWLALGGHHLELPQLARVMGQPVWKLEAECEALVARGAARRLDGLHVTPRGQVDITWTPARRLEAHRAIAAALRPGQEGRLFHLLAVEETREAAREAVEIGRRRASGGDLGAAAAALGEGLRAVRQEGDGAWAEEEAQILAAWVKVAFAEGTPHALDRVLYEITRARRRAPAVEPIEALVRAAIAAPGAGALSALDLVDGIPPFADPELERRRHRVRAAAAAGRSSPELLEKVLEGVAAWAERSGEPLALLSLAEGRAQLCYGQGRFEEAAALHMEAAEREPWWTGRIAATLNAASALLEAFRHGEAAERAEAGRELAARCRHPYWEGRAEWLLRAARYRGGEAGAPDLELVDAVARVGVPDLEALVCLTEAAAALRAEAPATAADLAMRAAQVWGELNRPSGVLLARSVALACGAPVEEGEIEALADRAAQCPIPGIGVQALGLLGRASPEARPRWRDAARRLAEAIPPEHRGRRMDVLSAAEALEGALGGPGEM